MFFVKNFSHVAIASLHRLSCPNFNCIKQRRTLCDTILKMKILNVAEKNDASKHIAGFLSRGTSRMREGFSKFNKIYEFECTVRGQRAEMKMTSVSGHLLQQEFDMRFKRWKSCSPLVLFEAPIHKFCPDDYKNIKRTLEREVRNCDMLIIWTDCDREGENIGFEIIDVCKAVKPNIQVFRAKFSEITAQSVTRAIQSLESPNKLLSDAVDVRSELDLRIGAAFTRFQTLRLQQVFPQRLSECLISYGSCQFPTLGFVVERYKSIERFIPEKFWKIAVSHKIDEVNVDFMWKRVRLFDQLACQVLLDVVLENQTATVEKVLRKPKSKWRPCPLETVELEKQGSKKLKITAKDTMKIAEKLYTQGYISYPRTETNIFPKEMNLRNLIEIQAPDNRWGAFAQRLVEQGPNPRQGKKSDQAHPPIHPTKYTNSLQGNEGRVYEFIVRHFLACCSKDALGQETIIDIVINGETFVASGLNIIERNYLEVYPYEKWTDKEIHPYEEGQQFQPSNIEMVEGETSAPKPLTEADLIALMEKHGIGTDATHAEHIETIKTRSYVGVNNTYFLPGELGLGLVDGYDSMGFPMSKPHLRAELEADLQRITQGLRNPRDVLTEQLTKYKEVFQMALEQATKIDEALSNYLNEAAQPVTRDPAAQGQEDNRVSRCSLCGQDMILKAKRDNTGYFITCSAYPNCRNAIWLPSTVEHAEVSEEVCSQCNSNTKILKFRFKRGSYSPFYPDSYEGCIGGCDQNFLETLGIQPQRQQNNTAISNLNPARDDNRAASSFSSTSNRSDSGFVSSSNNTFLDSRISASSLINDSGLHRGNNQGSTSNTHRPSTRPAPASAQNQLSVGGDAIVCQCNVDAIRLTVRKDGPNHGRQFYKCGQNSSCNFFMWADEGDQAPLLSTHNVPNLGGNISSSFNPTNSHTEESEDVKCTCGEIAKSLTVVKEGPNKGRQFYACSKPRDSQCNFFQWAEDNDNRSNTGRWDTGNTRSRGGSSHSGNGYTRPQGPNSFADENDGGSNAHYNPGQWSTNNASKGGRGAGSFGSTGSRGRGKQSAAPRAKRKCGNCGQEGHTRPHCPNL